LDIKLLTPKLAETGKIDVSPRVGPTFWEERPAKLRVSVRTFGFIRGIRNKFQFWRSPVWVLKYIPGTTPEGLAEENSFWSRSALQNGEKMRVNMLRMKITEEERRVFSKFGKRAYKNMVRTMGKGDPVKGAEALAEIARKQGKHGVEGGPPRKYPICTNSDGSINKRHRFWAGKCSLCGIKQDRPK
jgi:hypothetical protein